MFLDILAPSRSQYTLCHNRFLRENFLSRLLDFFRIKGGGGGRKAPGRGRLGRERNLIRECKGPVTFTVYRAYYRIIGQ